MNENLCLVSLIVPCYNVGKYIEQCVLSILNQTHENLEIILVDDGSSDSTGDILDCLKLRDSRIIVVHTVNGGVSSARNVGLDLATGEYVCFVDGDDWIETDYVEYLLSLAISNNADISITRRFHNSFRRSVIESDFVEIQTPEEAVVDLLYYKHMIGVYCKMINRHFIDKYKLRFMEDIFIGEGFNFTMDCFQRMNKLAVGQRSVYFYRRDNESSAMTMFRPDKTENAILAMWRMKERLVLKSEKVIRAWNFATWHTYSDMLLFVIRGKAINKHKDLYKKYKCYTNSKAYYVIFAPVSLREKVRALTLWMCPRFYACMMDYRQNNNK